MDNPLVRDVDAFYLGYLPALVSSQFDAVVLCSGLREGASPRLVESIEGILATLPKRGPDIVSCVWKIGKVMLDLGITPPTEPKCLDEAIKFAEAARAAVTTPSSTFTHALRCGEAERTFDQAIRISLLSPADHLGLHRAREQVRQVIATLESAEPPTNCPTTAWEAANITVALRRACRALDVRPGPEVLVELASAKEMVSTSARSLESAARGAPRSAIRGWFEKRVTGSDLLRHVAEHHRWSLLVRRLPNGDLAPRTMSDHSSTAMFAFSDRVALDARPDFLRSDREDERHVLTFVGALLLKSIPDDVDVLVLDATGDPANTVHYPRTQAAITRVADEVGFLLGATDWSRLDLELLRRHRYWIVADDDGMDLAMVSNAYGQLLAPIYSSIDALDAHLDSLKDGPARRAKVLRAPLPGHTLFQLLAQDFRGFVLNPKGPGRSREFNRATLEALARPSEADGRTSIPNAI